MKKRSILFAALFTLVAAGGRAQSFVEPNADGVEIKYRVTDAAAMQVRVTSNDYTGRVVIPGTVAHNDTLWTVVEVGSNAFRNSTVTYVQLPEQVATVSSFAFHDCLQLDTLRIDRTVPVSFGTPNKAFLVFGNMIDYKSVVVMVPCGSLQAWRHSPWSQFGSLQSECAHRLVVKVDFDSIVRFDSVLYSYEGISGNNPLYCYGNSYNEAGDTVKLFAQYWGVDLPQQRLDEVRRGLFFGWSTGEATHMIDYVMPDYDDTLACLVDTLPWATLCRGGITTPVFLYGNMSYNGHEARYTYNDISDGASSLYANALWIGNAGHLSAQRFIDAGPDFFPGPLRVGDATIDA